MCHGRLAHVFSLERKKYGRAARDTFMSKGQKIVTVALWAVLVLVMVAVIGAGAWDRLRTNEKPLPVYWPAPPFSLIDQNEKPVTDQSLRGHPYVAEFIFTQCAGPCPLMTAKMARLQKTIRNPAVKLISFDVDPDHDTPAVLKDYAAKFNADGNRWHFLTGKPEAIYAVAYGMRLAAKPADGTNPILHATQFLLIDGDGQIRGTYNTGEHAGPDTMDRLAHDADQLAGGKGP